MQFFVSLCDSYKKYTWITIIWNLSISSTLLERIGNELRDNITSKCFVYKNNNPLVFIDGPKAIKFMSTEYCKTSILKLLKPKMAYQLLVIDRMDLRNSSIISKKRIYVFNSVCLNFPHKEAQSLHLMTLLTNKQTKREE